ncbi:putative metalloprotease CJM1_0395 family protein [Aliidiomarina quisquiliarum]|uniref:putative metalloprotease CJM1_0395 family protein n=1 Tax=Aliidiomarina quisquiliarum TaxID=2938947 RepID=UPI00208EB605|nr:putative metalloprotease CJM1_0395 family protein [Aliidiomarina quisquiliarum]MCO4322383.1 catalase [Aliidiomarina quisquiliarum]
MLLTATSATPFTSNTVATPTDAMRRDNQQREIIAQVSQNEGFARESGLGSGADRAPMAGMPSFANQLAGARQDAENMRRRARGEEPESKAQGSTEKAATEEVTSEESSEAPQAGPEQLNPEEKKKVAELKERDAEVRRHEQTHASVGGQYAGTPNYETEQGPDGRSYAVGGSVDIDVTPIANDPAATIQKMQTVKRAALAVDEPSAADRNVANTASRHESAARQELASEKQQPASQEMSDDEIDIMVERSSRIESTYQGSFLPRETSVLAQA